MFAASIIFLFAGGRPLQWPMITTESGELLLFAAAYTILLKSLINAARRPFNYFNAGFHAPYHVHTSGRHSERRQSQTRAPSSALSFHSLHTCAAAVPIGISE